MGTPSRSRETKKQLHHVDRNPSLKNRRVSCFGSLLDWFLVILITERGFGCAHEVSRYDFIDFTLRTANVHLHL